MGAEPEAYLILSALLFTIGLAGVLIRRELILMLMAVELMLNAVNIALATVARSLLDAHGQLFVVFSLSVAAAEAAVGLALLVAVHRSLGFQDADDVNLLGG